MKKTRVGLIFGGSSPEHDVSVNSAAAVFENLDKDKYDISLFFVSRKGQWITEPNGNLGIKPSDFINEPGVPFTFTIDPSNKGAIVDIFFPLIHGINGEDGTLQGFLELLNIPYTGSGPTASAIGMDKAVMKMLFRSWEIPVPDFLIFKKEDIQIVDITEQIAGKIGFPCYVKPTNTGSSIGISRVKDSRDIKAALDHAFMYDNKIIIEKGLDAREIEVALLGHKDIIASTPGEVITNHGFYDYKTKYSDGIAKVNIPAQLNRNESVKLRKTAIEIFKKLGCSGMSRIDFFIDKITGRIYVNEINTIPGFTKTSMYPMLWKFDGIDYSSLLDHLIRHGFERYKDKSIKN